MALRPSKSIKTRERRQPRAVRLDFTGVIRRIALNHLSDLARAHLSLNLHDAIVQGRQLYPDNISFGIVTYTRLPLIPGRSRHANIVISTGVNGLPALDYE